jgi:hypothetical protein
VENDPRTVGAPRQFGLPGQIFWGLIGGLSPYGKAALQAVGLQVHYQFPGFSPTFYCMLALSAAFGIIGSILLESHTKLTAWFHGGSFPVMLNFLFGETFIQHIISSPPSH